MEHCHIKKKWRKWITGVDVGGKQWQGNQVNYCKGFLIGKDLDLFSVDQQEQSMGKYIKDIDFDPNKEIF